MAKIFISATEEDESIARVLYNELERLYDERPFFYKISSNMRQKWPDSLKCELDDCIVILLIGTANITTSKKEVLFEVCRYPDKVIILKYGNLDFAKLPSEIGHRPVISFPPHDQFALSQLDNALARYNTEFAIRRFLRSIDSTKDIFNGYDYEILDNSLNFEILIKKGNCLAINSYDEFYTHLKTQLRESDKSFHTMPVTIESIRNFYADESKQRGEEWRREQEEWGKKHDFKRIKRIAIIEEFELYDAEFKKALLTLLNELDRICDLRIYDSKKIEAVYPKNKFVPKDFGIFFNDNKVFSGLFTFVSIFKGQNFTKLTGSEYYTTDPDILSELNRHFLDLWSDKNLEASSDNFKKRFMFKEVNQHAST